MFFSFYHYSSQTDSNTVLTFNFNNKTFNELSDQVKVKPVGVSLVQDRFGNEKAALYLHGHNSSYLNLGTSNLLKPKKGTISLWVKLERKVYFGRGYESNPIIETKNSHSSDFYDAYTLFYDFQSDRFMIFSLKDSLQQAGVNSVDNVIFNNWYHLAFTYNNYNLSFYVNGKLQESSKKDFETVFLEGDSVVVGNTANKKNDRYTRGIIDDINIYHRVLSPKEIENLYNQPNPNRTTIIVNAVLKYLGLTLVIFTIAFLLVWQRRKALKREKEKFELNNKLHEMEVRTLKAQMNPHFIFNSLNSIQQFIMTNDNEKALIYLGKFSKLLRQSLESTVNENLSIQEEVDILNRYIEIEALRFNKTFSSSVAVADNIDIAQTKIPHLLIQPFVENAIWHGLLPKNDQRELLVKFEYLSKHNILCIIEDNGVGRKVSSQKENTFKKKSLALSFVTQRLELLSKILKVNCSVEIIDKTDEKNLSTGTKVIVIMPILNI